MSRPYRGLRVRKRTPRQRSIALLVLELTAELGRPPTTADIAKRLAVSRATALESLKRLERVGVLADLPKVISSGTWEVTRDGRAFIDADPEPPA